MSKSVVSTFGTFDEKQLESLKKGMREMSDVMTMMDAQKDALKEILNSLYEDLKIPKKIIRKMAKTYHKNNYSEVIAENEEFESLYQVAVVEDNV